MSAEQEQQHYWLKFVSCIKDLTFSWVGQVGGKEKDFGGRGSLPCSVSLILL